MDIPTSPIKLPPGTKRQVIEVRAGARLLLELSFSELNLTEALTYAELYWVRHMHQRVTTTVVLMPDPNARNKERTKDVQ